MRYSDRLRLREELWWARSPRRWDPRVWLGEARRRKQKRELLSASDPDAVWRAGPHWQRRLTNKWNAREFAQKYDCPLPELYWTGLHATDIPFATLPEHYVIRPVWGHSSAGVFVMSQGRDALRRERYSPAEIVEKLEHERKGSGYPLLVEEYLEDDAGEYGTPIELKCHVFAGEVGAVQFVRRMPGQPHSEQFCWKPDWTKFDEPLFKPNRELDWADRPDCLDEMLAHSRRLGRAYGSHVRIDFFMTSRGCVFNEFASVPRLAWQMTPSGDAHFGALWQEHCPDAV